MEGHSKVKDLEHTKLANQDYFKPTIEKVTKKEEI